MLRALALALAVSLSLSLSLSLTLSLSLFALLGVWGGGSPLSLSFFSAGLRGRRDDPQALSLALSLSLCLSLLLPGLRGELGPPGTMVRPPLKTGF